MAKSNYSRFHTYIKPVIENKYVRSSTPYIFSLVTVMVFIVFAIRPTISTIINLQKSIEESSQTLAQLNQKAADLTAAKMNFDNLSSDKKTKIRMAVPENAEVPVLILSLKKAVSSSDSALQLQPVELFDLTATPAISNFTLKEVNFSLNDQGAFPQMVSTLHNFNATARLTTIKSAVLSKRSGSGIVLLITGRAYYLK